MLNKRAALYGGAMMALSMALCHAASNPANPRTDVYRATFDILIDWTSGAEKAAVPYLELQNPKLNTYNMGVTIKIPFNPSASSTQPTGGVTKHSNPSSCSLSVIRIDPGEGLTVNALEVLATTACTGSHCGQPCSTSSACTGTDCHCIRYPWSNSGVCTYLGSTYNVIPDRVTFEVEVEMDSGDIVPSVRATDFLTNQASTTGPAEVIGVKDAEVDRDRVQ